MRTVTHKFFISYLTPLLPLSPLSKKAFSIGCVEPDINLFTHLGRNKKKHILPPYPHLPTPKGGLHGHDLPHIQHKIAKLTKWLTNPKRNRSSSYYAFKLGVLLHYLADAFTHVHNAHFEGKFADHVSYEKSFHLYFIKVMSKKEALSLPESFSFDFYALHEEYRAQAVCHNTDFTYILLATLSAMATFGLKAPFPSC